jgi:hypothetical protein
MKQFQKNDTKKNISYLLPKENGEELEEFKAIV